MNGVNGNIIGNTAMPIDPQLQPLGDYGGPTQTHRPIPTSPAVDAGDNTGAPPTDQRGFDRIVNGTIDIGSVELQLDELGGAPGTRRQSIHPAADLLPVGLTNLVVSGLGAESDFHVLRAAPQSIESPIRNQAAESRFAFPEESQPAIRMDRDSLDAFLALAQDHYNSLVRLDYADAINDI